MQWISIYHYTLVYTSIYHVYLSIYWYILSIYSDILLCAGFHGAHRNAMMPEPSTAPEPEGWDPEEEDHYGIYWYIPYSLWYILVYTKLNLVYISIY